MIAAGETLLATLPDGEAPAGAMAAVKSESILAPTALEASIPPPPPPEPHASAARRTNTNGAPRRFKSAFIIFSSMRHKQIKKELLEKGAAKKVRRKDCCTRLEFGKSKAVLG